MVSTPDPDVTLSFHGNDILVKAVTPKGVEALRLILGDVMDVTEVMTFPATFVRTLVRLISQHDLSFQIDF